MDAVDFRRAGTFPAISPTARLGGATAGAGAYPTDGVRPAAGRMAGRARFASFTRRWMMNSATATLITQAAPRSTARTGFVGRSHQQHPGQAHQRLRSGGDADRIAAGHPRTVPDEVPAPNRDDSQDDARPPWPSRRPAAGRRAPARHRPGAGRRPPSTDPTARRAGPRAPGHVRRCGASRAGPGVRERTGTPRAGCRR